MNDYSEEERYIRETLDMLQESYAKAAKPYIDRLVAIQSVKPHYQVFTAKQIEELGINMPDTLEKLNVI